MLLNLWDQQKAFVFPLELPEGYCVETVDCSVIFILSGFCRQGVVSFTAPMFLIQWLHVPGEGDMESSFQYHSLHLLCPACPYVAVNAAGVLQVGSCLEVSPPEE